MSIIHTFDPHGEEIILAKNNVQPIENFPETILVVFSASFCALFLEKHSAEQIGVLKAGGQSFPLYRFEYKGHRLGFFKTILGGAGSAALLEELIALGAQKLLYFGSGGALDQSIVQGRLLIPTEAYRDEGVSYHYAEASDYISIPTAHRLQRIFDDLHVPYHTTKTWTTDAFYRETRRNMELRRQDGCGIVEMECASIMAVGQFRQREIYQFLYAADCLDSHSWDKRILGSMPATMREQILLVALETACRL